MHWIDIYDISSGFRSEMAMLKLSIGVFHIIGEVEQRNEFRFRNGSRM
jgi:hypothetical protein